MSERMRLLAVRAWSWSQTGTAKSILVLTVATIWVLIIGVIIGELGRTLR